MRRLKLLLPLVLLVAAAGAAALWFFHRSTSPSNAYVDPRACAACHPAIAATYRKTGMGRSFYRPQAGSEIESFPAKPFYHALSESYFTMTARDGKYYQRRWQIGFDGKETNIDEKQADYVIGSGNHARTYLHLTSRNILQVLPLSWYSEKGGYFAMSPGYDHPDFPGSVRPIHYECFFCHDAYPKTPSPFDESEMAFELPLPEGIDCQRCHGPGQEHVRLASSNAAKDRIRGAIVNPKRLSADLEMDICLQCHLETTSRSLPHAIRRIDRGPFSFTAGEPLRGYRLDFDTVPGSNPSFDIAHAAYQFRRSQCYLKSEGKLRCTTCHDPHDIPRGEAAIAGYNKVCASCHAAGAIRVDTAVHTPSADCVACHMPKRRTDDVVHVVMTDHYIQRQKPSGDLLAAKIEPPESEETAYKGAVVPYYPANPSSRPTEALAAAIAQVRDRANLKEGVPKLAALVNQENPSEAGYWADLAQGYRFSNDLTQAIRYYREAAKREPVGYRLIQLGNVLMEAQQFPEAESTLRRAVTLLPNEPVGWGTLGWVLWQEDKAEEAREALAKGVALDPELPELRNNFGSVLWGMGQPEAAIREFREALRIQPGVAEWRANLAKLLASRGENAEARFQFEEALRLKPSAAEARADYARLLIGMNQMPEAARQVQEALRLNPQAAGAHELAGYLLGTRGNTAQAVQELEIALKLQPDLWRAHYELAMALGQRGDQAGAVDHLRAAAAGNDPEAAAAARQVLQRIQR